jgi:hypothetical protein
MPRTAANKTNGIDHLPAMLKHFDDGRLLDMTRRSVQAAERRSAAEGDYCAERAEICRRECERRGIRFSGAIR